MKFEDLQKIEALEVCEYTGNTLHLHCKQGYYLTEFTGDEFLNYTDFFCAFLPIKDAYADYKVIDKATHNANLEKKKEAIKEKQLQIIAEENKRRKELEENGNQE